MGGGQQEVAMQPLQECATKGDWSAQESHRRRLAAGAGEGGAEPHAARRLQVVAEHGGTRRLPLVCSRAPKVTFESRRA